MSEEIFTLDVVSDRSVPFRVLYLPPGTVSPNIQEYRGDEDGGGRIEIYDRRYAFTPDGQFTGGRYYVRDIFDRPPGQGLSLSFGSTMRDWFIDANTMEVVRSWLDNMTSHTAEFPEHDERQEMIFV